MKKRKTVLNAIDRIEIASPLFRGKRTGLITNASGVNKSGVPTSTIISEKFGLQTLFAPEHGIRTNMQDGSWGENITDPDTGAAVVSLHSGNDEAIDKALSELDVVAYDIQDVGARFYTYIYNLSDMMRRCAEKKKELVVFDRINPIGGIGIEGRVLDTSRFSSGIGKFRIPTRYGLTVGEFAKYINAEENIGCKLSVVTCSDWDRHMYGDETGLLWVNPSPNIPSVNSAVNYIGTCIFEATNISEGRGTTRPFDMVGAPFVDSARLCERMTSLKLDGVVFRRVCFTPKFGKYTDQACEGVELHITNRENYSPFEAMLYLYREFSYYREFEAKENSVCLRFGDDSLCGEYIDPEAILASCRKELGEYRKNASKYLMY